MTVIESERASVTLVDPATGTEMATALVVAMLSMPSGFPTRSWMRLRSCLNLYLRLRSRSLRCHGPQRLGCSSL